MDPTALAQGLRAWQARNPVADAALGFVPGLGQVYGAATAAAAFADPDASPVDRALATAGVVPFGRAAATGSQIVGGSEAIANLLRRFRGKMPREAGGDWWRGADQQLRVEIDDSAARLGPMRPGTQRRLDEVLDHPVLYEAYPQMRNLRLDFDTGTTPESPFAYFVTQRLRDAQPGLYDDHDIHLRLSAQRPDRNAEALFHEITHAGQAIERRGPGFRGTSPKPGDAREYVRDRGEQEANLVGVRRTWPAEARAAIPFPQHQRLLSAISELHLERYPDLPLGERLIDELGEPERVASVVRRLRNP